MSDLGNAQLTTEVDLSGLERGLGEAEGLTQNRLSGMASGLQASLGLAFAGIGVALAGALAGAGVAAVDIASQFNDAQNQMQAQLGLTADEAQALGDVARDVFGDNFGASVEDVGQSIIDVRQQMRGLADDELQAVTEGALAIRDAFGVEVAESTSAADTLMQTFGLSAQQAQDFITKGFQGGLNASDDFLDSIGEYSNLFAANGFSAEEFFSVMETGMQGGVLGTDKAADAFKEFGIIVQEMGDDVWGPDGTLQSTLGMSSERVDALFAGLKDGSVTIADVFGDVMPLLQGMEDPIARNSAGVALFGTMWEDMGAEAMLAIDPTVASLEDMAGATAGLGVQYNNLQSVGDTLWRQTLLTLEPVGAALLDLANAVMPAVLAGFEQLRAGVEVAVGAIGPIIQQGVAFVSSLLAGDGTAGVTAWGAAFARAHELIQGVMQGIMSIVGPILAILQQFWADNGGQITAFVSQAWGQIAVIVQGVMAILQATIIPILGAIGSFIGEHSSEIQTVLTFAWNSIQNIITLALSVIQGVVTTVLGIVTGDWEKAGQGIQQIVEGMATYVQQQFENMLSLIQSLGGSFLGAAQEVGQAIIDGIVEGINAGASAITDAARAAARSALDAVKNLLGIKSPSAVFAAEVGEPAAAGIAEGLTGGLAASMPGIESTINQVVGGLALRPALGGLSDRAHQSLAGDLSSSGGASSQTINFYGPVIDNEQRLSQIADQIAERTERAFGRAVDLRILGGGVTS